MRSIATWALLITGLTLCSVETIRAQQAKRLLLLSQGPDGHPATTHEYLAGQLILEDLLSDVEGLSVERVNADSPWETGPDLLKEVDGVVLFLSEGARWINEDRRRYQAFTELASRGGAIVAIHWATGTREAENIQPFLRLVGACHGGPDRKHAVFETTLRPVDVDHPVTTGLDTIEVREEFYYRLKVIEPDDGFQPTMTARIDDRDETVAWAWQRPDGGRSCGFTGLHFHENWRYETYRRLIVQSVLWSMDLPIAADGVTVDVSEELLKLNH